MITGNTEVAINVDPVPNNTNVINRVWTMVMDKVTDVIDYVMNVTSVTAKFKSAPPTARLPRHVDGASPLQKLKTM